MLWAKLFINTGSSHVYYFRGLLFVMSDDFPKY